MRIETLEVGALETNCYFIISNNDLIVVDPGADYELIKMKIGNYNLKAVFITHNHYDHKDALDDLLKDYDVPVNPEEVKGYNYKIISNPGHTRDSISFYFPKEGKMITGDFLFHESIGRTDLYGGNHSEMLESLEMISSYPDKTIIYPGHGPETILGHEKERFKYY